MGFCDKICISSFITGSFYFSHHGVRRVDMKKNVHFYTMLAVCTAIVCGLFSVYGTLAAREIQVYYAITPPPVKPVKPAVIRHGTAIG